MKQDDIRNCRDFEERVTPYVDDEVAPDTRRAVDAHMAACPPCRERMESERVARDVLHDCRTSLRVSAPPGLRARCLAARAAAATRSGIRRWVPLSVAATLCLAVGAVFLLGVNNGVEALAAGLTLDHVKCFKVSAPAGRATIDAREVGETWRAAQGWPLTVPGTAAAENLRLVDVRRCISTEGRVAHLMYLWRGQPLSVFVLPRATGRDRVLDSMGHETAIWSSNGRTYAVLATGHPEDFEHIVGYVKTHAR